MVFLQNLSRNPSQYLEQTSRTVPKLAMVVRTGIKHLCVDRFNEQRYLENGDLNRVALAD